RRHPPPQPPVVPRDRGAGPAPRPGTPPPPPPRPPKNPRRPSAPPPPPPPADGHIGQPPLIAAVHPARRPPAPGARRRIRPHPGPDTQPRPNDLHIFHHHPGQVRQQQLKNANVLA